jgi:hypothetical protein
MSQVYLHRRSFVHVVAGLPTSHQFGYDEPSIQVFDTKDKTVANPLPYEHMYRNPSPSAPVEHETRTA